MSESDHVNWPAPVKHLSDPDAAALDALLGTRNEDAQATGLAQDRDPRRTQRLQALLHVLDAMPTEQPDAQLVQRTVSNVRNARQRERFTAQQNEMRGAGIGAGAGLRQMATIAVMIVFGLALLLPVLERNRAESMRIASADDLRAAGAAFTDYARDHNGVLPRRKVRPGATWWNVGEPPSPEDGVYHSNSAHLYLLIERGYVDPAHLACPTNPHAPTGALPADAHDWRTPEQVSYSYQNQYTQEPWRIAEHPNMAVLADKNPLFVARNGRITFDYSKPADTPSHGHGRRGQNVLSLDGNVQWTTSPVVRSSRQAQDDNIWMAHGINRYQGNEQPGSPDDSFLVP